MYIFMNISDEPMRHRYSITDARQNLPVLIRKAENGEEVELTRRGKPVAVLVSHQAFKHLASIRRDFAAAYRDFRTNIDITDLELDPDELFGNLREETAGHNFRL